MDGGVVDERLKGLCSALKVPTLAFHPKCLVGVATGSALETNHKLKDTLLFSEREVGLGEPSAVDIQTTPKGSRGLLRPLQ